MTSHILVLSRRSGLCAAGFLSLCMLVSACGGGGGGLAAAGPVVLVDGTERFSNTAGPTTPDSTAPSRPT